MKTTSPYAFALTLLLTLCIAVPADLVAAPQSSNSRAGEVARVIPAVSIARGSKTLTASAKSVVDWQDLVNTQINGRARIAHEHEAGVRDPRRAGVGHQRYARTLLHFFHQFRGTRHLVMLVITGCPGRDAVVIQQFLRLPRIFTGDHVDFFEHAYGTQSDVLQIADRGGDKKKRRARALRQTRRVRIGPGRSVAGMLHGRSLSPKGTHVLWSRLAILHAPSARRQKCGIPRKHADNVLTGISESANTQTDKAAQLSQHSAVTRDTNARLQGQHSSRRAHPTVA